MNEVIDWFILCVISKLSRNGSKLREIISLCIGNSQISTFFDAGVVITLLFVVCFIFAILFAFFFVTCIQCSLKNIFNKGTHKAASNNITFRIWKTVLQKILLAIYFDVFIN